MCPYSIGVCNAPRVGQTASRVAAANRMLLLIVVYFLQIVKCPQTYDSQAMSYASWCCVWRNHTFLVNGETFVHAEQPSPASGPVSM